MKGDRSRADKRNYRIFKINSPKPEIRGILRNTGYGELLGVSLNYLSSSPT